MAKGIDPVAHFEEAAKSRNDEEMVRWIWLKRVRNGLMKARQRKKNHADVTVVSARGKKLNKRDNKLRLMVYDKLWSLGYDFKPRFEESGGKIYAIVRIEPLYAKKATE